MKVKIEKGVPIPDKPVINVEKGVPLPTPGSNPRTKMGQAMKDLEIGDSFVTDVNVNTIHSHARYYRKGIVYRQQPDGTFRVWRIK